MIWSPYVSMRFSVGRLYLITIWCPPLDNHITIRFSNQSLFPSPKVLSRSLRPIRAVIRSTIPMPYNTIPAASASASLNARLKNTPRPSPWLFAHRPSSLAVNTRICHSHLGSFYHGVKKDATLCFFSQALLSIVRRFSILIWSYPELNLSRQPDQRLCATRFQLLGVLNDDRGKEGGIARCV